MNAAQPLATGHRQQPPSGSIRHDHDPHVTNAEYPSFSLVVDPPRRRSLKCALPISSCASIVIARDRYLRSQQAAHARQRRRPIRSIALAALTHLICRAQIPIESSLHERVPLPAVSSLEGFRTPAAGAGNSVRGGRHPKTLTWAAQKRRPSLSPILPSQQTLAGIPGRALPCQGTKSLAR